LRCELAVLQANQIQAVSSVSKMQAQLQLTMNDLAEANRELAAQREALKWWADCVKSTVCVGWVNGNGVRGAR
jgi:hypothetical protein